MYVHEYRPIGHRKSLSSATGLHQALTVLNEKSKFRRRKRDCPLGTRARFRQSPYFSVNAAQKVPYMRILRVFADQHLRQFRRLAHVARGEKRMSPFEIASHATCYTYVLRVELWSLAKGHARRSNTSVTAR